MTMKSKKYVKSMLQNTPMHHDSFFNFFRDAIASSEDNIDAYKYNYKILENINSFDAFDESAETFLETYKSMFALCPSRDGRKPFLVRCLTCW